MKVLIALLILSLSACGQTKKEKDSASNPSNLSADQVVVMSKSSFGCEYLNKLDEAISHYNKKEFSAWAQITGDKPYCFSGSSLAENQTWTVLQIKGNLMQIGLTTQNQIDIDPDRNKHNYWTVTAWGAPVPAPKATGKPDIVEGYILQYGAFSNDDTALSWQKKFIQLGFKSYTEIQGDKTMVAIGVYPTSDAANKAADKVRDKLGMKELHLTVIFVPHSSHS